MLVTNCFDKGMFLCRFYTKTGTTLAIFVDTKEKAEDYKIWYTSDMQLADKTFDLNESKCVRLSQIDIEAYEYVKISNFQKHIIDPALAFFKQTSFVYISVRCISQIQKGEIGGIMNSFSKIIGIILAVILMFISPLLYMSQKQDTISQVVVQNETVELVNDIKNSGFISRVMYQNYISKIDKTGNLYNIEIVHSHKKIEPEIDPNTNTILESYNTYFYDTYIDEIYAVFDLGQDYYFKQGDYISFKVVNRNPTMAVKLMNIIYDGKVSDEQILVTYGGLVRDEVN
jgi:hypothetical protein